MTRVLIAVDDSADSLSAATSAHELFGDTATYLVVNVAEPGASRDLLTGNGLQWGIGYPVTMPIAGPMAAIPMLPADIARGDSSGSGEAPATAVDEAERRARSIADAAELPSAQAVGESGDVADAIVEAAQMNDADVIVVGSHERGWFANLLNRSTSGAVVRRSDIPVLVTPSRKQASAHAGE